MRIAFLHPDLGIGGAERLVVDAAIGLQNLGHTVHIYTSYFDPSHCFEETRDGTLSVHYIRPPSFLPRSIHGKGHIVFAHLRQLHLTFSLLDESSNPASSYDVFFVDQLSTCIPFLKLLAGRRVVFYGHFPDKLLADGQFIEGVTGKRKKMSLKGLYRLPMDWLEEITTRQADILLVNSKFTARIFREYFPSVTDRLTPRVVYPGINIVAYTTSSLDSSDPNIQAIASTRPTFISLNRFEKKKNASLAIEAFALALAELAKGGKDEEVGDIRLILAGGYDPRLQDNVTTLEILTTVCKTHKLSYEIIPPTEPFSSTTTTPASSIPPFPSHPQITFLLNFTAPQRTYLLTSPHTLALLYTPTNEHFGIGPVEGMISGLPIIACWSGGPTESVEDPDFQRKELGNEAGSRTSDDEDRTGFLLPPSPQPWSEALLRIIHLSSSQRSSIASRAKSRAKEKFSLEAMAKNLNEALEEAVEMGEVETGTWLWYLFVLAVGMTLGIILMWTHKVKY